jgi:putative SOS response-associated peptidase YedK
LSPKDYEAWLDPGNDQTDALKKLLEPYPADEMRAYPVGPRVNNARNDGPEIIEPVSA